MSVTFVGNIEGTVTLKSEPCLCAQMCDAFIHMMEGTDTKEIRQELASAANPSCPFCHGKGVEQVEEDGVPFFNVSDETARILFALFKLRGPEATIAEARRGLMRARAADLSPYVTPEERSYGGPVTRDNGVVELRPLRSISFGVSEDRIQKHIDRFADFVEESARMGATKVLWS